MEQECLLMSHAFDFCILVSEISIDYFEDGLCCCLFHLLPGTSSLPCSQMTPLPIRQRSFFFVCLFFRLAVKIALSLCVYFCLSNSFHLRTLKRNTSKPIWIAVKNKSQTGYSLLEALLALPSYCIEFKGFGVFNHCARFWEIALYLMNTQWIKGGRRIHLLECGLKKCRHPSSIYLSVIQPGLLACLCHTFQHVTYKRTFASLKVMDMMDHNNYKDKDGLKKLNSSWIVLWKRD